MLSRVNGSAEPSAKPKAEAKAEAKAKAQAGLRGEELWQQGGGEVQATGG